MTPRLQSLPGLYSNSVWKHNVVPFRYIYHLFSKLKQSHVTFSQSFNYLSIVSLQENLYKGSYPLVSPHSVVALLFFVRKVGIRAATWSDWRQMLSAWPAKCVCFIHRNPWLQNVYHIQSWETHNVRLGCRPWNAVLKK